MATQYLTLKKSDSEFQNFLWGKNENNDQLPQYKNKRALPVKTYNLGTPEESVTFELRNTSEIKHPDKLMFLASLIKLKNFILVLLPLFYVLSKNFHNSQIYDPLGILLAALSTVFLFAGLSIRNDVYDHITGFDRVNLDSNYKPIRSGWISAYRAAQISWSLIAVSCILALPVALLHLKLNLIIAVVVLMFLISRFFKNNSYKQKHLGEIILFLLIGPALVSGYQLSLGGLVTNEMLCFGALWGLAVVYLIQINNFSHIMTSSQAGIKNTLTKLGFDWSQKFLIFMWLVFIFCWFLFHLIFGDKFWSVFTTVVLLAFAVPLFLKITHIKSPMGSGLQAVRKSAHHNFLITVLLFIIENIWYLQAM